MLLPAAAAAFAATASATVAAAAAAAAACPSSFFHSDATLARGGLELHKHEGYTSVRVGVAQA